MTTVPLTEGETIRLGLIGSRDYFRAIDLAKAIEFLPGDEVDIRFLRPLSGEVALRAARPSAPLASIVRKRGGKRSVIYVEGVGGFGLGRLPENYIRGLIAIRSNRRVISILKIRKTSPIDVLDNIFYHFQRAFDQKYTLTRLTMSIPETTGLELVTVKPGLSSDGQAVSFEASLNGRRWCVTRFTKYALGRAADLQADIA